MEIKEAGRVLIDVTCRLSRMESSLEDMEAKLKAAEQLEAKLVDLFLGEPAEEAADE
jgi:hypothetical protein